MVSIDINIKKLIALSSDMKREEFKDFLEKFDKKDFVNYFLEDFDSEVQGDDIDEY